MKQAIKINSRQYKIGLLFFLFALFVSCSNDDDNNKNASQSGIDNQINDFVWKGLNTHYFWQEDIGNLENDKFNEAQYINFLNSYTQPNELFNDLLYFPGEVDRFSEFLEDYEVFQNLTRGVGESFGFEFDLIGLANNQVAGYVTIVLPNSPAEDAGMKRGDIFNEFNDVILNTSNFLTVNAFYSDSSIKIGFANIVDNNAVSNGKEETLNVRQVIENPIHHYEIIEQGSSKIGYLMYTQFNHTYHQELNNVFTEFKNENINELVLDLRYNPGGAVITATYLTSMIYSQGTESDIIFYQLYNQKNQEENFAMPFFNDLYIFDKQTDEVINENSPEQVSRLNLNRLYVLTGTGTASASELIINSLNSYMEVILIGETTFGKNVGSFTIYDSPDFTLNNVNPNHKNALQPISFMIFNKDFESDYHVGFTPDFEVKEHEFLDSGLKEFGDLEDPLLARAIQEITGVSASTSRKKSMLNTKKVFEFNHHKPHALEMYNLDNDPYTFK